MNREDLLVVSILTVLGGMICYAISFMILTIEELLHAGKIVNSPVYALVITGTFMIILFAGLMVSEEYE